MPATRKRRTRSKAPPSSQIVAPGGGTQNDVDNVAANLGLDSSSVAAILNCEGNGVVPVRRTRAGKEGNGNGGGDDDDKPVMSAAWSDFMNEEGYDPADATKEEESGSKAKKPKVDTAQDVKVTTTTSTTTSTTTMSTTAAPSSSNTNNTHNSSTSSEEVKRVYDLPLRPLMRPPSDASTTTTPTHTYPTPGLMAQTGTLDSPIVGRTKRPLTEPQDLQEPTLFQSTFGAKVALVASAPCAAHSICILVDGTAYAWGRNEMGQCGFGHTSACIPLPTKIELEGSFVGAAVGKNHSILIMENGEVYGVGSNKYGQCGVNTSLEGILAWKKCVLSGLDEEEDKDQVKIVQASCGENFTVVLDSQGRMYTAGLAEFGQLGNGETGEYFVTANKISFANSTKLERRVTFCNGPSACSQEDANNKNVSLVPDSASIRLGSIACGKHHTIAVEVNSLSQDGKTGPPARVFSWGCGSYGCLGHGVQVDEYTPRLVSTLQGPIFASNTPLNTAAGSQCSLVRTLNGHVYYWGKHRSVGEATMRPNLLGVLANNRHEVQSMSGGYQTVFCGTKNGVTIAWGNGATGELGYGASQAKSSSKPKFVDKLDSCLVTQVSCGYGHTLFIISDEDAEDKKAWGKMETIESKDLTSFVESMNS